MKVTCKCQKKMRCQDVAIRFQQHHKVHEYGVRSPVILRGNFRVCIKIFHPKSSTQERRLLSQSSDDDATRPALRIRRAQTCVCT